MGLAHTIAARDLNRWIPACRLQQGRITEWIWEYLSDTAQHEADRDFLVRGYCDRHFLLIAANHFATAVQQADGRWLPDLPLRADVIESVGVIRNVLEHWDETRPSLEEPSRNPARRSAKRYLEIAPSDSDPWGFHWNSDAGMTIGPLDVPSLILWLLAVEERLRELGAWPD